MNFFVMINDEHLARVSYLISDLSFQNHGATEIVPEMFMTAYRTYCFLSAEEGTIRGWAPSGRFEALCMFGL